MLGSDNKIYLSYYGGVYREFMDGGSLGPIIEALP
jgi:hypothetical protein